MAISPAIVAIYAPWGNAQLAFTVSGRGLTTNRETGDPMPTPEVVEYLAHISLGQPNWEKAKGADQTLYSVRGRLLRPLALDQRVTNGSLARATINGYQGQLEMTYDLSMGQAEGPEVGQSFSGTFRVTGRG
jgi:hypothetical protein